jgi:hypothetical protein
MLKCGSRFDGVISEVCESSKGRAVPPVETTVYQLSAPNGIEFHPLFSITFD